ncbi:MAG: hypothetical protein EA340_07570 [Nitriliruptor sp.]|nr:MAG: hypothetical protein EA340_07570 [Nitriliruptor sp.]
MGTASRSPGPGGTVAMRERRMDYRLQRRALLREVTEGSRGLDDVRDAHPDLVRAGVHIGSQAVETCPLCHRPELRHVMYVFEGKGPRTSSGRAVPREALAQYAQRHGDVTVYVVEVCTACHWHHLLESYRLLARGTAVG